MSNTLIIDTSYGSTVGVVGYKPIVETDSRTHVEKLQVNIDSAVKNAGLELNQIDEIVVGVGPAPFTGLRAGLVAAKAIAFANNAKILGCNSLIAQSLMIRSGAFEESLENGVISKDLIVENNESCNTKRKYVLSLNDARRRQVYMSLYDDSGCEVIKMDIDYPANIVERVNQYFESNKICDYCVCVAGHGAKKYVEDWKKIKNIRLIAEVSALDLGLEGLKLFKLCASQKDVIEPLYLRRPDVSVPNPLKHVLGSGAATKVAEK